MKANEVIKWRKARKNSVGYKIEKNKNAFAILLNTLMMEQGITKAELSRRARKSAPHVTRLLRGDTNLTISSMTELLYAIDCELHITGCHKNHEVKWVTNLQGGKAVDMNPSNVVYAKEWAKRNGHQAA